MAEDVNLSIVQMDFEQFNDAISSVSGQTRLLGPEIQPWRITSLDLDGVELQILQEGGANSFDAACEDDRVIFGMALPGPTPIVTQGVSIDDHQMVLLRPGEVFATHSKGVCRYCILTVQIAYLEELSRHLDSAHLDCLAPGRNVIHITSESSQHTTDLVYRIFIEARIGKGLNSRQTRQSAALELVESFLNASTSRLANTKEAGRPRISRREQIETIRDYLNSPSNRPHSITGLALQAGVSIRTLRRMVNELFGTSPSRLIQIHQLHAIRYDLLRASKKHRTVTRIAADHDVWELGRLSQRYRRLFGETPSETLAFERTSL